MSTILDHCDCLDDFEDLLYQAESQACNPWDMDFVSGMRVRFVEYGERMFLSDRQLETLERIAGA